ncbi:MAG: DUF928 domain-containing protein [Leptolyngbyaceae cyanobacterium]
MKYFAHTRLCLTLLGSLWLGLNTAARAEPESPVTTHLKSAVISEPAPLILFEPPNDDRVTTSRGGASRPVAEKCLNDAAYATPLTALIPESGIGLTGEAHPTLLVYVPPTAATEAHLTLRNNDRSGLYQSRIQLPQTGGILQITLPPESPELAVDQTYHWSLAILCQPTQTDLPTATGQIRRVELSETVEGSSLLSQAELYGRLGVWHDMLATLAALRQSQPDNTTLATNWAEVLQAENLDAIANTPLLD